MRWFGWFRAFRWLWRLLGFEAMLMFCVAALGLLVPSVALAAVPGHAVFPSTQVWVLAIGAVVPLLTYVLNHVGPWISEPVKAAVLVVVSAGVAALYTAVSTNVIGFNTPTLQLLLTGVTGALAAHHLLWKPSGVALLLGGGTNRTRAGRPAAPAATTAVPPGSPGAAA